MNYVPISSVAKLIGKCRYSSFEKELINILQLYHNSTWEDLKHCYMEDLQIYQPNVKIIHSKFPELSIDDSLSATENYQNLIRHKRVRKFLNQQEPKKVEIKEFKTERDVEEEVKEIIQKDIKTYIEKDDDAILEKVSKETNINLNIIESVAIKERGTVLEMDTIDFLKENTKYNGFIEQKRVRQQFEKYAISGKIDLIGLTNDEIRCVYEIKNRKSEYLHLNPPEYDFIQLYCYIYLIGKKKGKIVSQYNGDVLTHETVLFEEAEYEFENNIKPLLDKCIKRANKLIKNKYSKETFELFSL